MTVVQYISVEEAKPLKGLRVAFTKGLPNPWSLAARAIIEYKNIPYISVAQMPGEENEGLREWTGQRSAPVAMFDDERPRPSWFEIVLLAERLAPEPSLIPSDPEERVEMFGVCHEIASEDGLGWATRALYWMQPDSQGEHSNLKLYYSSNETPQHARRRVNDVIKMLAGRLKRQAERGSGYLVGDRVSAADFYWATHCNFFMPMSNDVCQMPEFYREGAKLALTYLDGPLADILIEHRDRIVSEYFKTPIGY